MDNVVMKARGMQAGIEFTHSGLWICGSEQHHPAPDADHRILVQARSQRTVIEDMIVINIQFHARHDGNAAGRVDMARAISLDPVFADRNVFAGTQRDSTESSSSSFIAQ